MTRAQVLALAALALVGASACATPGSRRQASLERAREAAAAGDLERAAEILRAALAFDPRDRQIAARLAGVYEDGRAYARALRLLESFPDDVGEPSWRDRRARLLLRCGRIGEGGRLATSLARRSEASVETLRALADVVVRRRLAPREAGDPAEAWSRELAEELLAAGDAGTAVAWLERLPRVREPEEDALFRALFELALAADDSGLVRRIEDLAPDAAGPLALLVRRRRLVLERRTAELARLDRRFLADFPDDPRRGDVLEAEARRHLARGELARAAGLADRALEVDAGRAGALVVRGLALEWSGRVDEGRAALRTVLALEPDNREAREALRATHGGDPLILRIESPDP